MTRKIIMMTKSDNTSLISLMVTWILSTHACTNTHTHAYTYIQPFSMYRCPKGIQVGGHLTGHVTLETFGLVESACGEEKRNLISFPREKMCHYTSQHSIFAIPHRGLEELRKAWFARTTNRLLWALVILGQPLYVLLARQLTNCPMFTRG